jgi:succinyl-CoA synthetase beta subunit
MRIFEYQGKEVFKKYGIPVPQGVMIDEKREIGKIFPDIDKGNGAVLKAQVLVGGPPVSWIAAPMSVRRDMRWRCGR